MKDLRPIRGRYHIQRLIEQGEHDTQDFKYTISDARKIARSLSAFANHRGGRLLVGVKDNGVIAGLRDEGDIYLIEQAAGRYCRPAVQVTFTPYNVGEGLLVLKAEVDAVRPRPVCVDEGDGRMVAYLRVRDENITVPPVMLRSWRYEAEGVSAMALDSDQRAMLAHIAGAGHTGVAAAARACHISEARAADMAARLAAIGLVSFVHRDGTFMLAAAEP